MTGTAKPGEGEGAGVGIRLNALLIEAGLPILDPALVSRFQLYFSLFVRWNARVNLSAIRSEEGILKRHFVESVACAHAVPSGITNLLDFGSGGGLPGIPIALCRPELSVTLAESQGKKAAFLREAIRQTGLSAAVHAGRAETLKATFDCVTLRAVDKMGSAVEAATQLLAPGGSLIVMTTRAELLAMEAAAGPALEWESPMPLPFGEDRVITRGHRP